MTSKTIRAKQTSHIKLASLASKHGIRAFLLIGSVPFILTVNGCEVHPPKGKEK